MEIKKSFLRAGAFRVYEGMAWADIDGKSGEVIAQSKPFGKTQAISRRAIDEARNAIRGFAPAPVSDAFIRFGHLPKGGKSRNYATGEYEEGVSVYAAEWDMIGGAYKRSGSGLDGAAIVYLIKGAPVYLVTGKQIGVGSDGEPVITNAAIAAELIYDPDKDGYIIK